MDQSKPQATEPQATDANHRNRALHTQRNHRMLTTQLAFVEPTPLPAQTTTVHALPLPMDKSANPAAAPRQVHRGHVLFDPTADPPAFQLMEGEIVIFRSGHPVDLVEAGEYVDGRMWTEATAVARTHCTLLF
jgi:hypothetical protein